MPGTYSSPAETGLYYLQSRYYGPAVGRFINADAFASTGQGILGSNMFAYCLNNPVNRYDNSGLDAETVATGWSALMWWLTLVDGPLPIGDILYYGGIIVFGLAGGAGLVELYDSAVRVPTIYCAEEDIPPEPGPEPQLPEVEYPGDDPTIAPEGTEWKGKGEPGSKEGNYYNPRTGESWHPDLDHPDPIGPHWDYNYRGSGGNGWRVFPDGRIVAKIIEMIY